MDSAIQQRFVYSSPRHTYTAVDSPPALQGYEDEIGDLWFNFRDVFFLLRLDTNQEDWDGLDWFVSIPEENRDDGLDAEIAVIDISGYYCLAFHSPSPAVRETTYSLVVDGVMELQRQWRIQRRWEAEKKNRPQPKPRRNQNAGFVYLVKSISGHYKIGRTRDIEKRIEIFGVKLPFEIELDHVIACENCVATESQLHAKYADKRLGGEWFALTPEDVAEIKAVYP